MIALVAGVSLRAASAGSMLNVTGSMSTNTGRPAASSAAGRGKKRVTGEQHFVARPDLGRHQSQQQCVAA